MTCPIVNLFEGTRVFQVKSENGASGKKPRKTEGPINLVSQFSRFGYRRRQSSQRKLSAVDHIQITLSFYVHPGKTF